MLDERGRKKRVLYEDVSINGRNMVKHQTDLLSLRAPENARPGEDNLARGRNRGAIAPGRDRRVSTWSPIDTKT